jgi:hypothetical protein
MMLIGASSPPFEKVKKDDGLIVRQPTLESPWEEQDCDQIVAFTADSHRSRASVRAHQFPDHPFQR